MDAVLKKESDLEEKIAELLKERGQYRQKISELEEQSAELLEERNQYRQKFNELRQKYVNMETHCDAVECELRDVHRIARRAKVPEPNTSEGRAPQADVRKGASNSRHVVPVTVEVIHLDLDDEDDYEKVPAAIGERKRAHGVESHSEPGSSSRGLLIHPEGPEGKRKLEDPSAALVDPKQRKLRYEASVRRLGIDRGIDANEAKRAPVSHSTSSSTSSTSSQQVIVSSDTPLAFVDPSAQVPLASGLSRQTQRDRQATEKGLARSSDEGQQSTTASTYTPIPPSSSTATTPSSDTLRRPLSAEKNVASARTPTQDRTLSGGSIAEHLTSASTLTLHPPPSSNSFTRVFISSVHGGNPQAFITRSRDRSRRFIFPMFEVNPHMPTRPGKPGLLLSGRHEMLQDTWTLFCRVRTTPSEYLYLGEYQNTLVGALPSEEFAKQKHCVKAAWVKQILGFKEWDVYTKIRARIWLRKNGLEVTDKNVDEEVERIRRSQGGLLSEQDVIRALENGEERIDIIRMECAHYDHTFVADLQFRLNAAGEVTSARPLRSIDCARRKSTRHDSDFVIQTKLAGGGDDARGSDCERNLRRSSRVKRNRRSDAADYREHSASDADDIQPVLDSEDELDWI